MVARLAAKEAGVEVHVDDDLAEIDFGAAEGLTYDQAKVAGVEIDLLGGPPENAPFHDGETWRAFAGRIALAAKRIEDCGPRIAVVTHGGVVRAMLTHWLDLSPKSAWRFAVSNATVANVSPCGTAPAPCARSASTRRSARLRPNSRRRACHRRWLQPQSHPRRGRRAERGPPWTGTR